MKMQRVIDKIKKYYPNNKQVLSHLNRLVNEYNKYIGLNRRIRDWNEVAKFNMSLNIRRI